LRREIVAVVGQKLPHLLIGLRGGSHLAEEIASDLLAERALINHYLLRLQCGLQFSVLVRETYRHKAEANAGNPNYEQEIELPAPHLFDR
jgi:hypothetical protein